MAAPLCHLRSLTYPREADAGDGPGEYVGHDGGVAVGSREVGVELERKGSTKLRIRIQIKKPSIKKISQKRFYYVTKKT